VVRENLDNKKRFFSPLFFPPFSLSFRPELRKGKLWLLWEDEGPETATLSQLMNRRDWLEEPVFLRSFCYSVHYFNRKKM
jgi:hypothetical protein